VCPACGAVRYLAPGVVFPAHPDRPAALGGVFSWCFAGDPSRVIVAVEA
jgi:hypothetical protein